MSVDDRGGAEAPDRVTFLRARRAELEQRRRATERALAVPDDKIAHYGTPASFTDPASRRPAS